MSDYEKDDNEGRKMFYSITSGHIQDYVYTDPQNAVDMYLTGYSGVKAVVEIKLRKDYTSTQIENYGGQMLELKKYNALMGEKEFGYKPLYAVMYPNNVLAIWDISYIKREDFIFEPTKFPKSTVEGKEEKLAKWVVDLKFDDACTIMSYKV